MSVDPNVMLVNASWNEQHSDVEYWLANGADDGSYKNAALSRAVQNHNYPILNTLLKGGADPKSCNLSLAAFDDQIDVLKALVEAGADPMVDDSGALFNATKFGFRKSVDYLYGISDVDLVLKNLISLNDMESGEVDQALFSYLSDRRQSDLEAAKLESETQQAAGAWSPDPKEADAQFERRYAEASQGRALEPQRQQSGARMRL